ncbi:MAG: type I methionyl aminopeptidase [bacterium]
MTTRLTEEEIASMREAGRKLVAVLAEIKSAIAPGVNLMQLEEIADRATRKHGALPSFRGYHGYPAATCLSVNEQIVHAVPQDRVLRDGDILSVDMGLYYQGVHADATVTWSVGRVAPAVKRLMDGTYAALLAGTDQVKPGAHAGDISQAIEKVLKARGLTIFQQFVGHGIGKKLHEDIVIPNFFTGEMGPKLTPGTAIAIEPIAGLGSSDQVITSPDGWTAYAEDSQPAAHFEHTVLVTDQGHEVLTPLETLIGS